MSQLCEFAGNGKVILTFPCSEHFLPFTLPPLPDREIGTEVVATLRNTSRVKGPIKLVQKTSRLIVGEWNGRCLSEVWYNEITLANRSCIHWFSVKQLWLMSQNDHIINALQTDAMSHSLYMRRLPAPRCNPPPTRRSIIISGVAHPLLVVFCFPARSSRRRTASGSFDRTVGVFCPRSCQEPASGSPA